MVGEETEDENSGTFKMQEWSRGHGVYVASRYQISAAEHALPSRSLLGIGSKHACNHTFTKFRCVVSNQKLLSSVNTFMTEYLRPSHQGDWPEPTKFDQLRIKTEVQLIQIIDAELDLGIRNARQALTSVDTWNVVEQCNRRAYRAYEKIARLILVVAEITGDERDRMQSSLEQLQGMLEALSTIGSKPTPAEEEIAALARAVWEARGCSGGLPEEDWFRAERALKTQRESSTVCLVA